MRGLKRRLNTKRRNKRPLYNHMPPSEIVAAFGEDCWRSYSTCTVVRDPWDRMVSWFTWNNRHNSSFHSWNRAQVVDEFERFCLHFKRSQLDHEVVNLSPAIDCYFRYENLELDVRSFIVQAGLEDPAIPFPILKSGMRDERFTDAHSLFTDVGVKAVERQFGDYAERFGYSFD